MACPAQSELVALLFEVDDSNAAVRHVRGCRACRLELGRLRAAAAGIQASVLLVPVASSDCLTDDEVARLVEGAGGAAESASLRHVAECGRCSHRVAAVARLTCERPVMGELERLELSGQRRRARGAAVPAALAIAASLVVVLLAPELVRNTGSAPEGDPVHRESAITVTTAPQIVTPPVVTTRDSLRWTGVAGAAGYEVRVFDRAGTLVWNPTTTDTALAIPSQLFRPDTATYLWKVEVRIDWDRWVASEWSDLTLVPTQSR